MAFCQNCGEELAYGAKFCPECGTPAGNTGSENIRKQEFAGEIKKCPSCGSEIPAFTSHCPNCGHEFSETKVDNSVKEFFERISDLDSHEDSLEDKDKREWHNIPRVFCILGSVLFLSLGFVDVDSTSSETIMICRLIGIGLAILFAVFPVFLTKAEKQKRSFIETFIVPNTKESIIEFLILSASQIQPRANPFTKEGKSVSLWNKVWKTKIRQTITKSKLVLMNDKDAQEKIAMIKNQYSIR